MTVHANSYGRANLDGDVIYANWVRLPGGTWGCRVFLRVMSGSRLLEDGSIDLTHGGPARAPVAGDKVVVHSRTGCRTVEIAAVLEGEDAMIDGTIAYAVDCAIVGQERTANPASVTLCAHCDRPVGKSHALDAEGRPVHHSRPCSGPAPRWERGIV